MTQYQLRARIPDELADQVKKIAERIEEENPGAEATISTICRFALQDYVRRDEIKRSKETLLLELPIRDLRYEEMDKVFNALNTLSEVIENNSIETVDSKEKRDFVKACDKATDLLMYKMGDIEPKHTAKENQVNFDKLHGRDQTEQGEK